MVILPMVSQYQRMLQRNLLYTAVTRSKDLLILLGEPRAYEQAIYRESAVRRTTLQQRIQEVGGISTALTMKIHQYEDEMAAENHGLVTSLPLAKEELSPKKRTHATEERAPQAESQAVQYEELTQTQTGETAMEIIEESASTEGHRLTMAMITSNQIDPLIGMTGITPWQFQVQ